MRTSGESMPLSPEQQAILFEALNEGAAVYAIQHRCTLSPFDRRLFREAWRRVVARHEALRLTVRWQGRKAPVQVVGTDTPTSVRTTHVRGLPADLLRPTAMKLFDEEFSRDVDLQADRLVVPSVVYSDDEALVAWNSHHIVMDGLSTRLMMADVVAEYDAQLAGMPRAESPPGAFSDYIRWRTGRPERRSGTRPQGRSAVLDLLATRPAPGRMRRVATPIPEGLVSRMRAFARRAGITPAGQFHAAWALAAASLTGTRDVRFGTTSYGRPPELSHMTTALGMFTVTRGMAVHVPAEATLDRWLHDLQRDLVAVWDGRADDGSVGTDPVLIVTHFPPVDVFEGERAGARLEVVDGVDRTPHPVAVTVFLEAPATVLLNLNGITTAPGTAERLVERTLNRLEALTTTRNPTSTSVDDLLHPYADATPRKER